MTEEIRTVLLYLCWTVVIVRISAIKSRQQRPLWFALLMLGLGITMLQAPILQFTQRITGIPGIGDLLSSLLAVGVTTTLLTFATQADQKDTTHVRRARVIACGATVSTMVAAFLIVTFHKIPTRQRFLPIPGTFTMHTVYWVAYLTYMTVVSIITIALLTHVFLHSYSWLVRTPVLFMTIAKAAFVAFLGTRVISLFSTSDSPVQLGTYISTVHTIGVSLGCSIAAGIPLVQGIAAWHQGNVLYPLWKELYTAVPHIALNPLKSRIIDTLVPGNSRHRLHRRLIEIRDGLLILREWVTADDLERIQSAIGEDAVSNDQPMAIVTASWLKVALSAHRAGLPKSEEPLSLVRQGGTDSKTELDWLREVAAVWSSPLIERCASQVNAQRLWEDPA